MNFLKGAACGLLILFVCPPLGIALALCGLLTAAEQRDDGSSERLTSLGPSWYPEREDRKRGQAQWPAEADRTAGGVLPLTRNRTSQSNSQPVLMVHG